MTKLISVVFLISSFSLFASEVDLQKSTFSWLGKKIAGEHHGTVILKSGHVEQEKGKLKSAEFVVDLSTIDVVDLDGEFKTKLLTHLKSPDFFDIEKYPTAALKFKEIKAGVATADLTIKGKTNPVTFKLKEDKMGYKGTLKFDRTKFDMIYNSKNFFKSLGDKIINDEVSVDFNVVMK